mgnify:FL=1
MNELALYVMSVFYIFAGIMHFAKPKLYLRMMPPWLPAQKAMNYISGAAEVFLGIGLVPLVTRAWAAWGIIGLLVAVIPANVYMLTSGKFKLPKPLLILRLPLQLVLIWWAYQYTGQSLTR